jgi:hypothetical protein
MSLQTITKSGQEPFLDGILAQKTDAVVVESVG